LLLAKLLAQAKIVNYEVDKNPTEIIKFRLTELNKKLTFRKKFKRLLNFYFYFFIMYRARSRAMRRARQFSSINSLLDSLLDSCVFDSIINTFFVDLSKARI
jgi:hypothetical protein